MRNILADNALFSAIVEASFIPGSPLLNSLGHITEILSLMARRKTSAFKEAVKIIEEEGVAIMLQQSALARQMGPHASMSLSGNEWVAGAQVWFRNQADFVSKWSLADASMQAGRMKGAKRSVRILKHIFNSNKKQLKSADIFLEKHGINSPEMKRVIEDALVFRHVKGMGDIILDVERTVARISDDHLDRFWRTGGTRASKEDIVFNAISQLRYLQMDLVDELATRATPKVGVNFLVGSDNDFVQGALSLLFKFSGIAWSANQTLFRAIKRMNGLSDFDVGALGSGMSMDLLKHGARKENIFMNLDIITTMVAGGFLIEAARDIGNGKTPKPVSPTQVLKWVTGMGQLGPIASVAQAIVHKKDIFGTPFTSSIIDLMTAGRLAGESVIEGDVDPLKESAYRVLRTAVPASKLVFRPNTQWDAILREWLDLRTDNYNRSLRREGQEEIDFEALFDGFGSVLAP